MLSVNVTPLIVRTPVPLDNFISMIILRQVIVQFVLRDISKLYAWPLPCHLGVLVNQMFGLYVYS